MHRVFDAARRWWARLASRPPAALRAGVLAAACVLVAAAAACSEDLEGGAGCPALCPITNAQVRDTVLDPVVLDTALAGVPFAGSIPGLLLAVRPGPDSLDVRAVVRFDSLPAYYAPPAGGDSVAITTLDSSLIRLVFDTAGTRFAQAVTLEAYDVDTTAADDTSASVIAPLYRPDRLLGRITLADQATAGDSVRLFLDDAKVAAKARTGGRLRVGLRIVSAGTAQLRLVGVAAGGVTGATAPLLRFDPAADTTYSALNITPVSRTPGDPVLATSYLDQVLIARAPGAASGSDIVVGGLPARRSYLRFDIPTQLVDSTEIVRAGLLLVQKPATGYRSTDTVQVSRLVSFGTAEVGDILRASDVTSAPDTLKVKFAATDSGAREIPVVNAVSVWRALPAGTPRTIILRAVLEGQQVGVARFFSMEAPAGLRPRLRLSYIPRSSFGIP